MTELQHRLRALAALQPPGLRVIERDLAYVGMYSQRDALRHELTEEEKRARHVEAQREHRRRLKERG